MLRSLLFAVCIVSLNWTAHSEQLLRVLDAKVYHLGTPGFPEWEEFAKSQAHGRRLDIQFNAEPNATSQTLFIGQRQAKARWNVLFNALAQYDQSVAAQAAALHHQAGHNLSTTTLRRHWTRAPSNQAGFTAYLSTMKNIPYNFGI